MIDESFHLTPLDVRRYEFATALRGYDKQRVDQFREQVADELERLTRLNADLDAKARVAHEQLKTFRERDKALNEALVSAQQLRGEIREQAEKESELIVREARAEAERLVEEARAEVRRIQLELDTLERARRSYLAQMRSLAERQLAEINALASGGASGAAPASATPLASPAVAAPASGGASPNGASARASAGGATDERIDPASWLDASEADEA